MAAGPVRRNVMTTAALTDRDIETRDAVLRQLDWDPGVDASAIAATAAGGVVALTGFVRSNSAKLAAERIAKKIRGVRGIANDIQVRLTLERTDAAIAAHAIRALERGPVPSTVQVIVHDGYVTLTGTVNWLHEKFHAEKAVRDISGVRGVFNHITVATAPVARDVSHRMVDAVHRQAAFDARHISVNVTDGVATLQGTVTTWPQREAVEQAAARAPGVTEVINNIVVEPVEAVTSSVDRRVAATVGCRTGQRCRP